jgi:N-acetylglucosaminyl-diphospho-decaprenol L-rhamnosyltransferase
MLVRYGDTTVASVFFGGLEVLERTLPTWMESFGTLGVNFVFVDNTPGEEVRVLLSKLGFFEYPNTLYEKPDANLGFASGANLAVKLAAGERVLLLNPDIYVDRNLATEVLAETLTADQPFVAFGLQTAGIVHRGIAINKFGFFVDSVDSSRLVIGPSGGAMLLAKTAFSNLGGFADQLFAWGEDAEFALRLYSRGIKTQMSSATLSHVGGHSVASKIGARTKARLINRNRILIARASYTAPARAIWLPLLVVAMMANMLFRFERLRTIRSGMAGLIEGFSHKILFEWPSSKKLTLRAVGKLCLGGRLNA